MTEVKYLTRKMLLRVASEGDRMEFNRQIEPSILPRITNERMPAVFFMKHEHIDGVRVKPHVRCRVHFRIKGDCQVYPVYIDMTMSRYKSLPAS